MISTKGRYGLRVMIDLAKNDNGSYIPLKDIADRQEISKKYLEIIVKDMVAGGLISGASGKGGGYKLNRDLKDYKIGEVLALTEGSLSPVACLIEGAEPCPKADTCKTLPMWTKLNNIVDTYLNSVSIADLI